MSLVLLVRPHDFIVEEMSSFLEAAGFRPVRISSLDELSRFPEHEVSGAVISTAVTSVIPHSFSEVLHRVRGALPDLPLAAATLSRDFHKAASLIRGELGEQDRDLEVVPLGGAASSSLPRAPNRLLLLRREDLLAPSSGASEALRAHFRPAVPA
ncbi:MAG: hypothetical protein M3Y59_17035 [Myxococcota bacterium]|nr:hypothetical protein [Myxococcota bacterium]